MGTLYVVATPIGNLEDVTLRAVSVLRKVSVIACEDTRVTQTLLAAHGIDTPTVSHHAHSRPDATARLVRRLIEGEDVALVSDAGTPLVSDPGSELVAQAIASGVDVVPIPGASALLAALVGSGLPSHRVLFLGFLPRKAAEQREVLAPLANAPYTVVVYEAPSRLAGTLRVLATTLGDRPAAVARELTKRFETFTRGSLTALADRFAEPPRGEVVVVIAPASEAGAGASEAEVAEAARRLLASGVRPAEAAKTLAGAYGLAKKDAYAVVLAVSR